MADKTKLKELIVKVIDDPDITVEDLTDESELIGENGLFFDSIDVLELIVEVEKQYGIKVQDNDLIQEKMSDFLTFYEFISENESK